MAIVNGPTGVAGLAILSSRSVEWRRLRRGQSLLTVASKIPGHVEQPPMSALQIHSFPYDTFQQRAIEVIDRGVSLFVAAPTGSGKTVLADYVIERTLQRGQGVIYTAPIKALSNQKFRDFTARHNDQVGIMTGDVTLNPTAPLLIMTTEIYRNALLERAQRLATASWIIFDEIHYLDDPERGTVWEEAILFTPPHINLLALSATIPNVGELAHWIRTIHGRPLEVIEETHRPVSLTFRFQCQNHLCANHQELKQIGYRGREDWRTVRPRLQHPRHRRTRYHDDPWSVHSNRLDKLVRHLHEENYLPCILFTFGRRRTEELAWEASRLSLVTPEESRTLRTMFDELCVKFELRSDRTAEALRRLIDKGVAYHHAGMLPTMKEVVERCFTSRLVKLIVTTETFALGINMPARSVVLDALSKRSDSGFQLLRRREFLQMSGRAGRRGMDQAGFVYLRVNPTHITYPELLRLLHEPPEPVHSRFNTAYATLLNLYRHRGRTLLGLFPKTLYYFQTSGEHRQAGLELMERKLNLLGSLGYLVPEGLTPKGEFASWLYGYELLLSELHAVHRLHGLDPIALAVLILATVYEPRPGIHAAKAHRMSKRLAALCREPLARIHQAERMFQIVPRSKTPAFSLTQAMEAWMHKMPFDRVTHIAGVDEGEIVRYFRMTVQLLRQVVEAPSGDAALRDTAARALQRINRDVIDAEAQLRLG